MIPRHDISERTKMIERMLDRYMKRLSNMTEAIKDRPENLGNYLGSSRTHLGYAVGLNRPKEEVVKYLEMVKEFGRACFVTALGLDSEMSITLAGEKFSFGSRKSTEYIDVRSWELAFYCSVILRDKDSIEILSSIPEQVHREANAKASDECMYKKVTFLKGLYNSEAPISDLLVDAYTDAFAAGSEYVVKHIQPELKIYRSIFSEGEDLTENLTEAINLHKEYYSTKDNYFDGNGWLSLPILAACVVAYGGKGLAVEVESDYIPSWLIRGEF